MAVTLVELPLSTPLLFDYPPPSAPWNVWNVLELREIPKAALCMSRFKCPV